MVLFTTETRSMHGPRALTGSATRYSKGYGGQELLQLSRLLSAATLQKQPFMPLWAGEVRRVGLR